MTDHEITTTITVHGKLGVKMVLADAPHRIGYRRNNGERAWWANLWNWLPKNDVIAFNSCAGVVLIDQTPKSDT